MSLYIDSAYLDDITEVARIVPLAGVTTNPTILLNAYQHGQRLTVPAHVLLEMVTDPNSEQAIAKFEQDWHKMNIS